MNRNAVSNALDGLVLLRIRAGGRWRSAFHVLAIIGLTFAIGVSVGLALYVRLSLGMMAAGILTALATLLTLTMITKIIVGEERLTYYHHEIAILAMTSLALWALGQPVLAYLDILILAVGVCIVFGRVGCFMVGCCHGRPHRWGVRYRPEHADAGFPAYLVGVRLIPIQLVESAWVLVLVLVGVGLVFRGAAPGAALAWYVVAYDLGRFGFEFLRGDPSRPYWGGFSEAQWTSLLLLLLLAAAESSGVVPLHAWHLAAAGGLALAMIAVVVYRRLSNGTRHRLLSARHIREVAEAVRMLAGRDGTDVAAAPPRVVHVARTSAGLRLSTGRVQAAEGDLRHYTLSASDGALREVDAHAVAELLALLQHRDPAGEVLRGRAGVFHALVLPPNASRAGVHAPELA